MYAPKLKTANKKSLLTQKSAVRPSPVQYNPLLKQLSRMGNAPNPSAHAAILNRAPASQQSSKQELLLLLQQQHGNDYVNRVLKIARANKEETSVTPREKPVIQAKLTIGQAGDKYEQEADRTAHQVIQKMSESEVESETAPKEERAKVEEETDSPQIQQKCSGCGQKDDRVQMKPETEALPSEEMSEEEDKENLMVQRQPETEALHPEEMSRDEDNEDPMVQRQPETEALHPEEMSRDEDNEDLMVQRQPETEALHPEEMSEDADNEDLMVQRKATGGRVEATPDLTSSIQRQRGKGQPLPGQLRQQLEQAFGKDFSRVRIHADANADALTRSIKARAFTIGQDIFFRQGEYTPESKQGQELLAHELTHVVQQNGDGVKSKEDAGVKVSEVSEDTEVQHACAQCEQEEKAEGVIQAKEESGGSVSKEAPEVTTATHASTCNNKSKRSKGEIPNEGITGRPSISNSRADSGSDDCGEQNTGDKQKEQTEQEEPSGNNSTADSGSDNCGNNEDITEGISGNDSTAEDITGSESGNDSTADLNSDDCGKQDEEQTEQEDSSENDSTADLNSDDCGKQDEEQTEQEESSDEQKCPSEEEGKEGEEGGGKQEVIEAEKGSLEQDSTCENNVNQPDNTANKGTKALNKKPSANTSLEAKPKLNQQSSAITAPNTQQNLVTGESNNSETIAEKVQAINNPRDVQTGLRATQGKIIRLTAAKINFKLPQGEKTYTENNSTVLEKQRATASSMASKFLTDAALRVHTFTELGESISTRINITAENAKAAVLSTVQQQKDIISAQVKQKRIQAESLARETQLNIETQHGEQVGKINEKNRVAIETIGSKYTEVFTELREKQSQLLENIDTCYGKTFDYYVSAGTTAAIDAEKIGGSYETRYLLEVADEKAEADKVFQELKQDMFDESNKSTDVITFPSEFSTFTGDDDDSVSDEDFVNKQKELAELLNKSLTGEDKARIAREVTDNYKISLQNQANKQANDLVDSKKDIIESICCATKQIRQELFKNERETYDNLEELRKTSVADADCIRTIQTKQTNQYLEGTLQSLDRQETAQLQILQVYGDRQVSTIETDAQKAIASLQDGVNQTATKLLDVLQDSYNKFQGMEAPHPEDLSITIAEILEVFDNDIATVQEKIELGIATSEQSIKLGELQLIDAVNKIAQVGIEEIEIAFEEARKLFSDLNNSSNCAFTKSLDAYSTQIDDFTQDIQKELPNAINDLINSLDCTGKRIKKDLEKSVPELRKSLCGTLGCLETDIENYVAKAHKEEEENQDDVNDVNWLDVFLKGLVIIAVIIASIVIAVFTAGFGLVAQAIILPAVGALAGFLSQIAFNAIDGKDLMEDTGKAALMGAIGGLFGTAGGVAGRLLAQTGKLGVGTTKAFWEFGVNSIFDITGEIVGNLATGEEITAEGILMGLAIGASVDGSINKLQGISNRAKVSDTFNKNPDLVNKLPGMKPHEINVLAKETGIDPGKLQQLSKLKPDERKKYVENAKQRNSKYDSWAGQKIKNFAQGFENYQRSGAEFGQRVGSAVTRPIKNAFGGSRSEADVSTSSNRPLADTETPRGLQPDADVPMTTRERDILEDNTPDNTPGRTTEIKPLDTEKTPETIKSGDRSIHYDKPEIDPVNDPGVVAKQKTDDGHEIKVLQDGRVIRCSRCEDVMKEINKINEKIKSDNLKDEINKINQENDENIKLDRANHILKDLEDLDLTLSPKDIKNLIDNRKIEDIQKDLTNGLAPTQIRDLLKLLNEGIITQYELDGSSQKKSLSSILGKPNDFDTLRDWGYLYFLEQKEFHKNKINVQHGGLSENNLREKWKSFIKQNTELSEDETLQVSILSLKHNYGNSWIDMIDPTTDRKAFKEASDWLEQNKSQLPRTSGGFGGAKGRAVQPKVDEYKIEDLAAKFPNNKQEINGYLVVFDDKGNPYTKMNIPDKNYYKKGTPQDLGLLKELPYLTNKQNKQWKQELERVHVKGERQNGWKNQGGKTSGLPIFITRGPRGWSDAQKQHRSALEQQLTENNRLTWATLSSGKTKWYLEISHMMGAGTGGHTRITNAWPASLHQNTEQLAIEEVFRKSNFRDDLLLKFTNYINPKTGQADFMRIKILNKHNQDKIFDHIMDATRGDIDKNEVRLLQKTLNEKITASINQSSSSNPPSTNQTPPPSPPDQQAIESSQNNANNDKIFTDVRTKLGEAEQGTMGLAYLEANYLGLKETFEQGLASIRWGNRDWDRNPAFNQAKQDYETGLVSIRGGNRDWDGNPAFNQAKQDYETGLASIRWGNRDWDRNPAFNQAKQDYADGWQQMEQYLTQNPNQILNPQQISNWNIPWASKVAKQDYLWLQATRTDNNSESNGDAMEIDPS
ncbi:hypothetical protein BC008_37745 [Mastigocoleus testarum BC008]|uniref:eCIS core domain-containing protein n=1 Tax=Mastigocoleus testarum BC008 TaxID=371196 RepID=A0A0V7ZCG0_9CYAN|nr:hypothetical protein BC008_37745 [Mastigocoleus testarum BC008]